MHADRLLPSLPFAAAMVWVAALAGACASESGQSLAPQFGQKAPDTYVAGQPYPLTKEELALDCKKLTGRMQVRILQVRDSSVRGGGSTLARTTQSAVIPVFGGTSRGADPAADFARDRAYLEALNKQLATKNCATFDLDSELQPRSIRDTPTPIPKK
jgi:hypothetical protein